MRGVVMRGVGKRMLISETGEVLRLMHTPGLPREMSCIMTRDDTVTHTGQTCGVHVPVT